MWLFKDFVIIMNCFESRIVRYLSNALIWRKSHVESCWKGAHSFNSVIEIFALDFRAFDLVKVFAIAILIGHAIVIFSPHKINFGILATLIANRIFTQHFSAVFGGLKYLKFWGKRGRISFSAFCLLRGLHFVKIYLFDLSCLLDYFQLDTQY